MTQNKQFKREVRARMEITGEAYNVARRQILAEREREGADREAEADADKAAGLLTRYNSDEEFLASLTGDTLDGE